MKNFSKLKRKKQEKYILLNLKTNTHGRHLYALVERFASEGYKINIVPRLKVLGEFYSDPYAKWILDLTDCFFLTSGTEGDLLIKTKNESCSIILANQYFNKSKQGYRIPIAMHPTIYRLGILNVQSKPGNRKNAAFFAGNLNSEAYDTNILRENFNVDNRIRLINQVYTKFRPRKKAEYRRTDILYTCVLIDRNDFYLDFHEYLDALNKHRFFLACPGIIKPTAHNLTEAIYNQCIPIIQKSYADLLNPPLENMVTCLHFEDLKDINNTINYALGLSEDVVRTIQNNLQIYFDMNMSNESVVRKIINASKETVYLEKG